MSGQTVIGAEIAIKYGIKDAGGRTAAVLSRHVQSGASRSVSENHPLMAP